MNETRDFTPALRFHALTPLYDRVVAATVAEHTFALLLGQARHLCEARKRALQGSFSYRGLTGFELEGTVHGVIGCGRIGTHVARIEQGFGMEVQAYDPGGPPEAPIAPDIDFVGWPDLLERSDVVSLHLPLTLQTHHLVDESALVRVKPGVMLPNRARGALIDEAVLLRELERGTGAAPEAPMGCVGLGCDHGWRASHPLLRHPHVLATPHVGFNSEAVARILQQTVDNIAAWKSGRPQHRVA